MNGTLLGQTKGSDAIVFLYDEKANKYGFDYNGTKYYYIFNVQGDVIGILNQAGNQIVSYTYDAWGKVLSVDGSEASTIGQLNPIRYRGYYYDTETGFYYLQSRYYDPAVRRFLNSDILVGNVGSVGQNNLFNYCSNNPVNFADPTGYLTGIEEAFVITLLYLFFSYTVTALAGGVATTLPPIEIPSFPVVEYPPIEVPVYNPPASDYSQSISQSISIGRDIAAEQEQTASSDRSNPKGSLYYHVTTYENAMLIMASQALLPRSYEGGYVYAWRLKPTKGAVKFAGLGTKGQVIISFRTNAAFERDPGVDHPYSTRFLPVRSVLQGRVTIWDINFAGSF